MVTSGHESHRQQREWVPGASPKSHNSLESKLKTNNEISEPNPMFTPVKYICDGISNNNQDENFWSRAWTQWIFPINYSSEFPSIKPCPLNRGNKLWAHNYGGAFQLFC